MKPIFLKLYLQIIFTGELKGKLKRNRASVSGIIICFFRDFILLKEPLARRAVCPLLICSIAILMRISLNNLTNVFNGVTSLRLFFNRCVLPVGFTLT